MKRALIRAMSAVALAVLIFGGSESFAQEFKYRVEHDHLFKSCEGELIIDSEGVEYRSEEKDHARKWSYRDIQMLKLVSAKSLEVISYESGAKRLGLDRVFEFNLQEGEITVELSEFLLARVERPMSTSIVATEEKALHEIAVRHRHRFGGCQGMLRVYGGGMVYESSEVENSRHWRWSDLRSISRAGPYRFAVTTFEGALGGAKTYSFDLKERMDDTLYEYIWSKVNRPALPRSFEIER